jgi:hypothetical protein
MNFCGELARHQREENILTLREYINWRYELLTRCDPL